MGYRTMLEMTAIPDRSERLDLSGAREEKGFGLARTDIQLLSVVAACS
jgi:hypothetical protein